MYWQKGIRRAVFVVSIIAFILGVWLSIYVKDDAWLQVKDDAWLQVDLIVGCVFFALVWISYFAVIWIIKGFRN